jgi:hypothetical protein
MKSTKTKHISAALLSILLSTFSTHAAIELSAAHTLTTEEKDGRPLYTVQAGESFQIKVTTAASKKNNQKLSIEGLEKISVEGQSSSQQMQWINGQFSGSISYIFSAHIAKPGEYTVGPARLDGEASGSITIIALDASNAQTKKTTHTASSDVRLTLEVNKSKIILGEPIIASIRFYPQKKNVTAITLAPIQSSDFLIKELGESKHQNGGDFYIERQIQFTGLKKGVKTIGPLEATYEFIEQSADPFSDPFGSFFGSNYKRKTTHSQAVEIHVEDAPETDQAFSGAIGTFSSLEAHFDSLEGEVNEPITLRITLHGEGNLSELKALDLAMPSSLKYYHSKNEYPHGHVVFEYIVIPRKAETLTIPKQSFTYFDTTKREYKTLHSKPVTLTIKPGKNGETQTRTAPKPTYEAAENNAPPLPALSDEIRFIEEDGPVTQTEKKPISALAFSLLLLIIAAFGFINKTTLNQLFRKRKTPKNFALKLKKLKEAKQSSELYTFFKEYCASTWNIDLHALSEEKVHASLKLHAMSEEKIDEFLEFLKLCAQNSYFNKAGSDQENLFKEAHYWFAQLEALTKS